MLMCVDSALTAVKSHPHPLGTQAHEATVSADCAIT